MRLYLFFVFITYLGKATSSDILDDDTFGVEMSFILPITEADLANKPTHGICFEDSKYIEQPIFSFKISRTISMEYKCIYVYITQSLFIRLEDITKAACYWQPFKDSIRMGYNIFKLSRTRYFRGTFLGLSLNF